MSIGTWAVRSHELSEHEAGVLDGLREHDLGLAHRFCAQLAAARDVVLGRVVSSLVREELVDLREAGSRGLSLVVRKVTATGRLVPVAPVRFADLEIADPATLLRLLGECGLGTGDPRAWRRMGDEMGHSVTGQALAMVAAELREERLRRLVPKTVDRGRPFSTLLSALRADGGHGSLLVAFEQLVVDGHPLHPGAKLKIGMSPADVVRYGPEFGVSFDLGLVAVLRGATVASAGGGGPPGMAALDAARAMLREAFPVAVASAEGELRAAGFEPGAYALIPVHPHQRDHALPVLHGDALADGSIVPLRTGIPAEPLMSLRTLSVREPGATLGLHIKTALSVRVTGAVRGLTPATIQNAPRISDLIERIAASDLDLCATTSDGLRRFVVCRELAAIGYVPPEARLGPPDPVCSENAVARGSSLCAVLREDLESMMVPGDVAMPVASLTNSPLNGRSIVGDLLTELHTELGVGTLADVGIDWLRQHVELCVPPILTLLVRYGIALEPHGQNTVLVLAGRWPERVLVRDLASARVLLPRLARRGFAGDRRPGSRMLAADAESLRSMLYFPLFSNHLGELIAVIAKATACDEDRLWAVVRQCVIRTVNRLVASAASEEEATDARQDAAGLLNDPWRYKNMLTMRLASLVTDLRYADAPNPLRAAPVGTEPAGLTDPEKAMFDELRDHDPELLRRWLAELPTARLSTVQRALGALVGDGLLAATQGADTLDQVSRLLDRIHPNEASRSVEVARRDLEDSARNLALSRASVDRRRETLRAPTDGRSSSEVVLDRDAMCAEGHLLHPFGRNRREFSAADSMAYAAESADTVGVQLVALRRTLSLSTPDESGRSVGELIGEHYPEVVAHAVAGLRRRGYDPSAYDLIPVHPWQARNALPREYAEELASGALVPIPEAQLACRPTVSLRSLVTATPGSQRRCLTIKTALDVLITSARRTLSPDCTRDGPRLSALLNDLITDKRIVVVADLAGIAFAGRSTTPARERGLSALLREDPGDLVSEGESALSACALRSRSSVDGQTLLGGLLAKQDPHEFLADYASLLLSATLPLMWRYGIALEAHLQNTLLVVQDGRPVRLLLRDFAGLRAHRGRMRQSGIEIAALEGSDTIIDSIDEVRAIVAHAVVHANLADVIDQLTTVTATPAAPLWDVVRAGVVRLVDQVHAPWASEDVEALLAPTLPRKALATMRLCGVRTDAAEGTVLAADGDCYTLQPNPLHLEFRVLSG